MSELDCECRVLGFTTEMKYEELKTQLRATGTCTSGSGYSPGYICPNVDKLLRHAEIEHRQQENYAKKRKREGGDIGIKPKRTHKRMEEVDINVLF